MCEIKDISASAAAAADCSGDTSTLSFLLSDLMSTETAQMCDIPYIEFYYLYTKESYNYELKLKK